MEAYAHWTLPRSEAPDSIILWTGLYAIASVLKRNVCFPRSLMGSYAIYPNLYIIVVGPAGVVRKSTTTDYAYELLSGVEDVVMATDAMSDSALLGKLVSSKDHSLSIISSEFGTFINVSEAKMYNLLTDLYGGKIEQGLETRARGLEVAKAPSVNLLAATTPEWMRDFMPGHVIGGGFASRVMFLFENKVRTRQLYYDHVDYKQIERIGQALKADLVAMSKLTGSFRHDSLETKQACEDWYQEVAEQQPDDERKQGYFNRRHVHLHKVMMLLSASEGDSLVVTMSHFDTAKRLLEDLETKLTRVYHGIGLNPYTAIMDKISDWLEREGKAVPIAQIYARFYSEFPTLESINPVLSALCTMGRATFLPNHFGQGKGAYIFGSSPHRRGN